MKIQKCIYCEGTGQEKVEVDDMFGYVGYYMQTCENCEGEGYVKVYDKVCKDCNKEFVGREHETECEPCWQHTILSKLGFNEEKEAE